MQVDQTELQHLMDRVPISELFARYGIRGKGRGKVIWAKCCFHGEKTASLKINDEQGIYYCFGCGAKGNHIDVLRELGSKTFQEAVEALGGKEVFVTTEERAAIEQRKQRWEAEEREARQRVRSASERIFAEGKPVAGTHVEAYLKARGLPVVPRWTFDLRFAAELKYRGFPDTEADDETDLGHFPAMLAAIRDRQGAIIGLHRTYLDPQRPAKLSPPGDERRNKAKKVMGEQRGGIIQLSPMSRHLAIGEGIETSQAWYALGMADGDVAVAAAVSLGNLSGSATGSAPHPTREGRTVPNGSPDMERPGLLLPREVEHVTLIGDGDSDPHMTRARLLVAARRFHTQGIGVSVSMAPDGKDFADVLLSDEETGT
ncbi:CHC2 zinc finger domain-containing protein [Mesorhizobium sp. Z1-4]|uniref:DUF7146 domain-containing protein n=1 Tax=Mesorhizobium sp. Z1-4 TaxID=2448478 RepID=UPI0013DEF0EC|nr:CHC2 zinc finger domain-containing protein [Mesorhizobium sp. Z1-4]